MNHREALANRAEDVRVVRCFGELSYARTAEERPGTHGRVNVYECARCGSELEIDDAGTVVRVRASGIETRKEGG